MTDINDRWRQLAIDLAVLAEEAKGHLEYHGVLHSGRSGGSPLETRIEAALQRYRELLAETSAGWEGHDG